MIENISMEEVNTEKVHCQVKKLASGIHTFTLVKATRQAIQEGAVYYRDQRENHYTINDPMLFLFDLRPDGFPPLAHTFHLFKALFEEYPMPHGSRAAYLMTGNQPMISVAASFYELLHLGTTRKFFTGNAEHRAIAFLLEKTES
jgi:hypothetical protein